MRAGMGHRVVAFIRAATVTDDYGQPVEDWGSPDTVLSVPAMITFGSAQEKREAAQLAAAQTATFQCRRSSTLDSVTAKDRIEFDGSQWQITSRDPLDRHSIRFTATRII
jgi:SPP1 family predicted phage head-tail adaptor